MAAAASSSSSRVIDGRDVYTGQLENHLIEHYGIDRGEGLSYANGLLRYDKPRALPSTVIEELKAHYPSALDNKTTVYEWWEKEENKRRAREEEKRGLVASVVHSTLNGLPPNEEKKRRWNETPSKVDQFDRTQFDKTVFDKIYKIPQWKNEQCPPDDVFVSENVKHDRQVRLRRFVPKMGTYELECYDILDIMNYINEQRGTFQKRNAIIPWPLHNGGVFTEDQIQQLKRQLERVTRDPVVAAEWRAKS